MCSRSQSFSSFPCGRAKRYENDRVDAILSLRFQWNENANFWIRIRVDGASDVSSDGATTNTPRVASETITCIPKNNRLLLNRNSKVWNRPMYGGCILLSHILLIRVNERPRDISLARLLDLICRVYQRVNDVSVCYYIFQRRKNSLGFSNNIWLER